MFRKPKMNAGFWMLMGGFTAYLALMAIKHLG